MPDDRGRSATTVALLIVAVLLALWLLRFVVGVFVRLAQVALLLAIVAVGAYALYRVWQGWTREEEDRQPVRTR